MRNKIIFIGIALMLWLSALQAQVVGTPYIVPNTDLEDCVTPSFSVTRLTSQRARVNEEFELEIDNIIPTGNVTFLWEIIDPAVPGETPTNATFVGGINTGTAVTILADTAGSYRVRITATSNEPSPCNEVTSVVIEGVAVDDLDDCIAPTFTIEQGDNLTVNRGTDYSLNITSGFTPANVDFSWEILTNPANTANTGFVGGTTGTTVTLNSPAEGTTVVRVTATSNEGTSGCLPTVETREITITSITPNCLVPEFTMVPVTSGSAFVDQDYIVNLEDLNFDPNDPDITVTWEVLNNSGNNPGASIVSSTNSSVTVRATSTGIFRVFANVTSNTPSPCNSVTIRKRLVVRVERPDDCQTPDFNIQQGDILTVNAGDNYNLNIESGFTPADTTFSWEIITQDGTATNFIGGTTGESVTLNSANPGNAVVRVTATSSNTPDDCSAVSVTKDINIDVINPTLPNCTTPTFTVTRVSGQRATTNINYTLEIQDLDPAGVPVLWEIVFDDGTNVAFVGGNTGNSVTVLATDPGTFRLRVTATGNVPTECNEVITRDFVNVAVDDADDCETPNFNIAQGASFTAETGSNYNLNIESGFTPSTGVSFSWEILNQGGTNTSFIGGSNGNNVTLNSTNVGTVVVRVTATSTTPNPCNAVTATRDISVAINDPVNQDCEQPIFSIRRVGPTRATVNEDYEFEIADGFTPDDTTFEWFIVNDNGTNVMIIGSNAGTSVTVRASSTGNFRIMAVGTSANTPAPCNPTVTRVRTTTVVEDVQDCDTPNFDIAQGSSLMVNSSTNYSLNVENGFTPTDATFSWQIINQGGTATNIIGSNTGQSINLNSANEGTVVVRVTATSNSPSPCNQVTATRDISITVSDVPLDDCTNPTSSFVGFNQTLVAEQGENYTVSLNNFTPTNPNNANTTFEWFLVNDNADSEIIGSNTGTSVTVRSNNTGTLGVRIRITSNSPSPCTPVTRTRTKNVTVEEPRTGICANGVKIVRVGVPGITSSAMSINCDTRTIHRAVYGHKSITSFTATGSLGTSPYNSQIQNWNWPGSSPQTGAGSLSLTREQMNNFTSISGTNGFNDPNQAGHCINNRTPHFYWNASITYNPSTGAISCSATSNHLSCQGHPYDGVRSSNVCEIITE